MLTCYHEGVRVAGLILVLCAACVFDGSGLPADTPFDAAGGDTDSAGWVDLVLTPDSSGIDLPDMGDADMHIVADQASIDSQPKPDLPPADTLPTSKFGTPTAIAKLNSGQTDDDPSLTADMLEIFFDSSRSGGKGGGDIWTSTRTKLSSPWSTPKPASVLNSSDGETTPEVTPDGLAIYFSSHRPGGKGSGDIYRSTRASRSAGWTTPKLVAPLNSSDGDYAPTVSQDRRFIFMSSVRPGKGDFDLYTATRANASAPWSAPKLRADLDTQHVETDPWYNTARTVLYFATDRPGGKGGWDIWWATRNNPGVPFTNLAPVPELNSPQGDSDVWLSPDQKVVYLSSNRNGNTDLFIAVRK
jgi:Tol biopolymer transport system component